jgi:hypothetical protein
MWAAAWSDAMTPEEALRIIISLVDRSDEMEDAHALQILLQSIKTLAEKGLGRSE